jgi:nicotinamidase-related amidase
MAHRFDGLPTVKAHHGVVSSAPMRKRSVIIPTPGNSAVLFLDLQKEIVGASRTVSLERLRRTSGVLAKLAALHGVPAFLSAVPPGGDYLVEVTSALADAAPSMRTQTSAFADASLVAAVRASGRKVLLLAGVASEIVVQRTALEAVGAGYDVLAVVDACGGIDTRTEDAAWRRIVASGGATTSCSTVCAELAGDFTTERGRATLGLMYEAIGG